MICSKCQNNVNFASQFGVLAVELDDAGPKAIWSADMNTCPSCKAQTLFGFAKQPASVRGDGNFDGMLDRLKANPNATVVEYYPGTPVHS